MKCKNCDKNEAIKYSKYSKGEFCCRECARAYSTKEKRVEINKLISKTLTGRGHKKLNKKCPICKVKFEYEWKKRKIKKYCSNKCRKEAIVKGIHITKEGIEKISKLKKEICLNIEERVRLREIGRKGGFGKKGYTNGGIYYQSTLEKKCFEFLEENNIKFEAHKNVPNSSKISDLYLPVINYWIEIDGIDREKRQKWIGKDYDYWLEKLEIYKKENL